MTEEIKKLNKLIEKLDKNIDYIKSGITVSHSGRCPLTIKRIIYFKERSMYLLLTDQLNDYLCIDADSFDKAMAVKETM